MTVNSTTQHEAAVAAVSWLTSVESTHYARRTAEAGAESVQRTEPCQSNTGRRSFQCSTSRPWHRTAET